MQIDIADAQLQGLGQPEPHRGDHSEQRAIGHRAQASQRGETAGVLQQLHNLCIAVDVRRQPTVAAAERIRWRYLAVRLELPVVGRKRPQHLDPVGGSHCAGSLDMLSSPFEL